MVDTCRILAMISRTPPRPDTLRDALDCYLQWAPDLKKRTIQRMGTDVRRAVRIWGNVRPADLQTQDFARLRQETLNEELAVSTIEATISTVYTLLRFLHELGGIDRVPSKGRVLRKPPPSLLIPPLEDFGKLYAASDSAKWPRVCYDRTHWWKTFFACAYFTGFRLSDLLAMRWDWIRDDGTIEMHAQKTGKRHLIPMHDELVKHLREVPRFNQKIFRAAKSSLKCLRRELKRMSDTAGVHPAITVQQLRRLSCNEWERARPGCGLLIQGGGFKGAARYYMDPQYQLLEAVGSLRVPAEMRERPDDQLRLF